MKHSMVCVFAFNRPDPVKMVLERLSACEDVLNRDVVVYIDGARNGSDEEKIADVINIVKTFQRTSLKRIEIRCRERNYGCQGNISGAITEVLSSTDRIIVIEDDVLVSKYFLRYMDSALDKYYSDKRIWGVNGHQCPYMKVPRSYRGDVYLSPRNLCTGWGTWRDRWMPVDFEIHDWLQFISSPENADKVLAAGWDIRGLLDRHYEGKLNSWALPCTYYMIKNSMYVIEPRYSLTKNIGFGIESVHTVHQDEMWSHQKYYNFDPVLPWPIDSNEQLLKRFRYVYQDHRVLMRVVRKLKRIVCRFGSLNNNPINMEE